MFYYNTKYNFALPAGAPQDIPGGIIAASAMPSHQLIRRKLKKSSYLQHRLFDPQLYLAGLTSDAAPETVVKLSSYGWFSSCEVPVYDSLAHGTMKEFKNDNRDQILRGWSVRPHVYPDDINRAVRAAIGIQLKLGCSAVILPSPLTSDLGSAYELELRWLDIGLEVCREMRLAVPVFATIAISDPVLRGLDPESNPLLSLVTDQVTARDVAGAYIVVEQASESGYCCTHGNTLYSLLLLVDDIVRGGNMRAIVNYAGLFGAVANAAGAEIWSSGYYQGQRRLKLADFEVSDARARPRYQSLGLAGDIGVEEDLGRAVRAGLAKRVFTNTSAAQPLHGALYAGLASSVVSEWEYRNGNVSRAQAHYVEIAKHLGEHLEAREQQARVEAVNNWLHRAAELADRLQIAGVRNSRLTELSHQSTWLRVFERWRNRAGV